MEVDDEGAFEIASRARGTPRIANRLLRRVRDFAQVRSAGKIDKKTAQAALRCSKWINTASTRSTGNCC